MSFGLAEERHFEDILGIMILLKGGSVASGWVGSWPVTDRRGSR